MGGAGLIGTVSAGAASGVPAASPDDDRVPFHGAHQAGILTPQQRFGGFAAFDVLARDRTELTALFRKLTVRSRALTAGVTPKDPDVAAVRGPEDRLTITVGVGASLFDGRFGLEGARPPGLTRMPRFPGDRLEPEACHGDLSVQVCAQHPDAVLHVVRDLARETSGLLRARWRADGFVNPPRPEGSPRSFTGFKDGTAHPDTTSAREMDRLVWVGPEGPDWARGGSYQVLRTIRLGAEAWDRVPLGEQERIFGRRKSTGAPLDGKKESDPLDYGRDPQGRVTPLDSHIRRANPRTPGSEDSVLLRRSYNVDRGLAPDGTLDVGLVFCCYQRDVDRQFATVQKRLEGERFADFSTTTGGGYFLVLPGVADASDWYGSALLGS
ncbi:Dyp-type peroxidase [Streptomyces sp. MBT67]|nr:MULTISPECIES: Dyp-type peroxidase [unclassified Streptomyces]MBK3532606.1 Dyp-type peroxidase [Streptomyces sp. MBT72]MBK3535207.1 Dyp-type peroxidase [Streptomyces sp. MBT67]MBK3550848.1 Dyp-type peroxidase [Streptomyces sp. MBT61]MBK6028386.1 Dyp-type peroxidase [Streptomyces sp. MBT59]